MSIIPHPIWQYVDLFNGWKRDHEDWDGVTDLIREAG